MNISFRIKTLFGIIMTVVAVLIILSSFFLKRSVSKKIELDKTYESALQEAKSILASSKVIPTHNRVAKFQLQQTQIQKQYEDLLTLLDTASVPQINFTPLEFKEDLLKTHRLLVERANLWNIKLPISLGFPEFEGGNIPSQEDIPPLALQLNALRTLINLLIESRVQEVGLLSKKEIRSVSLIANQTMYKILPFELAFKATTEGLRTFLYKISSSGHLFIIRKINLESEKGDGVAVNMTVEAIKLKRSSE